MRINKPSLVRPELAHSRSFEDQMGVVTPRTIGQRTVDLSSDKIQGRKPPILSGGWQDDSAGPELAELLHGMGLIRNESELGVPAPGAQIPPFLAFSNAQSQADTVSTTDTVNFQTAIMIEFELPGEYEYRTWILSGANFAHSASGTIDRRIGGAMGLGIGYNATMLTTREHYPTLYASTGAIVSGPGILQVWLEYRCGTAGTASCRAPWIVVLAGLRWL